MNEKENDKKDGANETHVTHEANGTHGANGQGQRPPLEPKPFLPKKGNYRGLLVYQKAECLYDITFYFAHHYFVERKDRTIDQVVQAARSGKQNIAEGCAAAATSAETELKLVNVARASMKELLVDYEDYLRVRGLQQWAFDDERTQKTRDFCKKHEKSEDFMQHIEQRSDEAIANITITLLHQFDNIIGAYIAHLEKTFVENGGIREQMTAARLGYRSEQKARIAELEAENRGLKARIAELEQKLRELIGPMGLIGLMGLMGRMGLISLIGLIGPMGLMGCSSSSDDGAAITAPAPQPMTQTAITFSGQQGEEQVVNSGAGARAYEPNETRAITRAGTPLSDAGVTTFKVWGYKNMSYTDPNYGDLQTVFPGYTVKWSTAGSTTSNSNGWEYVAQQTGGDPEQTIKYWDWGASAYRYFAVTGSPTHVANAPNGPHEFTFAADCSGADDEAIANNIAATQYFTRLWFSTGNVGVYPDRQFGKPVVLEFLKPFARVRFLFNYSYAQEGIRLKKNEFKPTDGSKIALVGTVTVSYPTTGTATKESYTATPKAEPGDGETLDAFTEEYIPEGGPTKEIWYTVLPRTSQGSYTMSVWMNSDNVSDPATRTAVVPAEYMTWQPGYSYTYIFKITEQGGVEIDLVQSAVTPWTELENDHQVYNW